MSDPASKPVENSLPPGLYIVATPIGNLEDLSPRAARFLRQADVIACEDTRVTARLLHLSGSDRRMIAYHKHSAPDVKAQLLQTMQSSAVALVSDAGTPLISDPGHELVQAARQAGVSVTTAPGPCAAIAALSIAGLPTERFLFMGFLPTRDAARNQAIAAIAGVPVTLVFHETAPRLGATLAALARLLGPRPAAIARELTKIHEEVIDGSLDQLAQAMAAHELKGEIVVIVGPPTADLPAGDALDQALLTALQTLPPGKAAASVAAALGLPRADVYQRAMQLRA